MFNTWEAVMARHNLYVVRRSTPPSVNKIALAMAAQSRQGALDLMSPTSSDIFATAALQAEHAKKLSDPRLKKMQHSNLCKTLKAALKVSWADVNKKIAS